MTVSKWQEVSEPQQAEHDDVVIGAGLAGTMRPRSRARGPGPRGSAGDETGAGGPEPPASPVVPSQKAGDGGSHPTTAF